jgi:transposase-like protein
MSALDILAALRWPNGVECPHCGSRRYYSHDRRAIFGCAEPSCRKQFSPTTGTDFHHRKLSPEKLALVFEAFRQCAGPSDLMRAVGVEYKTAHDLWQRLSTTGGRLA